MVPLLFDIPMAAMHKRQINGLAFASKLAYRTIEPSVAILKLRQCLLCV
jgi:hypothetical protein